MKKQTPPATPPAPVQPAPKAAQAAPGAPFTFAPPTGTGALQNAPPGAAGAQPAQAAAPAEPGKTPQIKCKLPSCTNLIWVRRGKRQDYCGAACRAQATIDQPLVEGACEGCRNPMPPEKAGRRYCSNSCRARASERRAGATLASASIAGWKTAYEASQRECLGLRELNSLLRAQLVAVEGGAALVKTGKVSS